MSVQKPDTSEVSKSDSELEAMSAIVRTLEPLTHDARVRVLGAALCLLHRDVATVALTSWRAGA